MIFSPTSQVFAETASVGWLGYRRRDASGASRIASAAAITVGLIGLLLGVLRVALVLAAIDHVDRMLG